MFLDYQFQCVATKYRQQQTTKEVVNYSEIWRNLAIIIPGQDFTGNQMYIDKIGPLNLSVL